VFNSAREAFVWAFEVRTLSSSSRGAKIEREGGLTHYDALFDTKEYQVKVVQFDIMNASGLYDDTEMFADLFKYFNPLDNYMLSDYENHLSHEEKEILYERIHLFEKRLRNGNYMCADRKYHDI